MPKRRAKLNNDAVDILTASKIQYRSSDAFNAALDKAGAILKSERSSGYEQNAAVLKRYSQGLLWIEALQVSDADVCNGGFRQYFDNSTSAFAVPCIEAWYAIGLSKTGDIFAEALLIALREDTFRYEVPGEFGEKYLSKFTARKLGTWEKLETAYYRSGIPWREKAGEFCKRNPALFTPNQKLPKVSGLHVPLEKILDTHAIEGISAMVFDPQFKTSDDRSKRYGDLGFVTISMQELRCPLGTFAVREIREGAFGWTVLLADTTNISTCGITVFVRRPTAYADVVLRAESGSEYRYKFSLAPEGRPDAYIEELCGTFQVVSWGEVDSFSRALVSDQIAKLPTAKISFGLDYIQLPDRKFKIRSIREKPLFWNIQFDSPHEDWKGELRVKRSDHETLMVALFVKNNVNALMYEFSVPSVRP